jgi:hypothetical protein
VASALTASAGLNALRFSFSEKLPDNSNFQGRKAVQINIPLCYNVPFNFSFFKKLLKKAKKRTSKEATKVVELATHPVVLKPMKGPPSCTCHLRCAQHMRGQELLRSCPNTPS